MTSTIIAISTPPGKGGIGIIRISGQLVTTIIPKLFKKILIPRKVQYSSFFSQDNESMILDKVIALFFSAPHSFTGEDVLEIHGHGGEIILDLLLEQILKISNTIRIAKPGEFTERAFLNGKIDLLQAEAIADIIDASSYQAAKSAANSLQGILSKKIKTIIQQLINLRTHIELSIDFSEETNNFKSHKDIQNHLKTIINDTMETHQSIQQGVLLREGLNIIIAGPPNAGKSTLFNKLINMDRAIVSKIPGTTRDTLRESIEINGINLHITDTAGLHANDDNEIEKIGIQRTWNQLNYADHILWVVDSTMNNNRTHKKHSSNLNTIENLVFEKYKNIPITIIRNKSDLSLEKTKMYKIKKHTCIALSALLNDGINLLKKHLSNSVQYTKLTKNKALPYCQSTTQENQGNFIARRRHLIALEKSLQHLSIAQEKLISNEIINDIFAEDLKLAQYELYKIIGHSQSISETILNSIFSQFCIGK